MITFKNPESIYVCCLTDDELLSNTILIKDMSRQSMINLNFYNLLKTSVLSDEFKDWVLAGCDYENAIYMAGTDHEYIILYHDISKCLREFLLVMTVAGRSQKIIKSMQEVD